MMHTGRRRERVDIVSRTHHAHKSMGIMLDAGIDHIFAFQNQGKLIENPYPFPTLVKVKLPVLDYGKKSIHDTFLCCSRRWLHSVDDVNISFILHLLRTKNWENLKKHNFVSHIFPKVNFWG